MDGLQGSSCPRYGPADPIAANMGGPVSFEAPELPEETLMEVRGKGALALRATHSEGGGGYENQAPKLRSGALAL